MMSNPGQDSPPLASTSHLNTPAVNPHPIRSNGGTNRSSKSTSHSFTTDLASYLEVQFIPNVKPTKEEYTIKETQRLFLQQLADTVSKGAKLLPFGYATLPSSLLLLSQRSPTIINSGKGLATDCIFKL